jgi:putative ABC transport system permease protein
MDSFLLETLEIGLLYSTIALSITFLFRVVGFPDLTPDGSFILGAAVSFYLSENGYSLILVYTGGMLSGALAGTITALVHKKLNVSKLLSGILVSLALYSISLRILGSANKYYENDQSIYGSILGTESISGLLILIATALLFFIIVFFYLKTKQGLLIRALGDSEDSFKYRGINTLTLTIIGVALGNGIASLSGAIISQYQGFVDVSMGVGITIGALTAMVIGESILRPYNVFLLLASPILGSIIFQYILASSLEVGLVPTDLKAVISIITILLLYLQFKAQKKNTNNRQIGNRSF